MKTILSLLFMISLPLSAQERSKELAEQLLEALDFEQSIMETGDSSFATVQESLAGEDLTEDEMAQVKDAFMAYMERLATDPKLKETTIASYQKHYTDAELKELIKFYGTPLGKKVKKVEPQITAEVMQLSMKIAQKHVGPFQQTLQDILAKKAEKQLEEKEDE